MDISKTKNIMVFPKMPFLKKKKKRQCYSIINYKNGKNVIQILFESKYNIFLCNAKCFLFTRK